MMLQRSTSKRTSALRTRSHSDQNEQEQPAVEWNRSGLLRGNLGASFITSLVEFQKAQCYYIIAIQVASMKTLDYSLVEDSIAQQQATAAVTQVVATLGVTAPTVVLLCLWILKHRSWYILSLTITAFSLSADVFSNPKTRAIPRREFQDPENYLLGTTHLPFLCSIQLSDEDPPWRSISVAWVFYICGLLLALLGTLIGHMI